MGKNNKNASAENAGACGFDKIKINIKEFFKTKISVSLFIVILALGFITASLITLLFANGDGTSFDSIKYLGIVNRSAFLLIFALTVLASFAVSAALDDLKPIYTALAVLTVLFASALAGFADHSIYLNVGLALVVFIVFMWLLKDGDRLGLENLNIKKSTGLYIVIGGVIIFTVYLSFATAVQYLSYREYTFDFGLFAQMFDQMKTTGKPFTTIERGGPISHFAVHFSPIYYLFLPGYLIFSSPVYLYIIQALAVCAGGIAVYLICTKLKFSPIASTAFSFIYLLFPTMSGGLFYDFHENKFLSVCVLFLIYFILEEKPLPIFLMTLALLMVKEDAAIYVFAIALFVLLARGGKRMKIIGASMLSFAVVYFFFATNMISAAGGNPMISRLSDYYNSVDGNSLSAIVKTIFYDIGYLLKMCFTATASGQPEAGKLMFMLWIFIPLLFTPFMNERISIFVLLIPMGVINLMQSWQYQYDIDYQYTYGSVALVIFMSIFALASMSSDKKRWLITSMLALCIVFFVSNTIPKANSTTDYYFKYKERFDKVSETLDYYRDEFESSSVTASDNFTSSLYYVDDLQALYHYNYPSYYVGLYGKNPELLKTDYYVLDLGGLGTGAKSTELKRFVEENYNLVENVYFLQIYKLKSK